MTAAEIIRKKRDAGSHDPEEIRFLVRGALSGEIHDYQVSAWLMAAFLRGLDAAETWALTREFVESGVVMDYPGLDLPLVDKHSTGGVGDKTSLVVAPLVGVCGCAVPMISGRGLGHTGGTLDKLEAIPGFRTDLSLDEFRHNVQEHGVALIGATAQLAPGDRYFYRLRDVTATVESVPLIVASILSKKVAEGIEVLVLDVKTGAGAFMEDLESARYLAGELVKTGRRLGKTMVAVISDMTQPLGCQIGNALEVREAIEVLQGGGPSDTRLLCLELAAWMIHRGRPRLSLEEARALASRQLDNGEALAKFRELVTAQGGQGAIVDDPSLLARTAQRFEYTASAKGYLHHARADVLGRCALLLGAGRRNAADSIDHAAGVTLHKKVGDEVEKGEVLATLHYDDPLRLEQIRPLLKQAFRAGPEPVKQPGLICEVIS